MQLSQFSKWLWVASYSVAAGAIRQLQPGEHSAWLSGGGCHGSHSFEVAQQCQAYPQNR